MADIYVQYEKIINTFNNNFTKKLEDLLNSKAQIMKKDARSIIVKKNRIDTGRMLDNVASFTEIKNNTFSLILEDSVTDNPKSKIDYVSFQEFGTKRGIKPALFITNSFEKNIQDIYEKLNNIIEESFK